MPDPTQSVAEALAEVRERTAPPPEPTAEQKATCDDGECGGCIVCYGPGVPVFGPSTVVALADEIDRLSALLAGEGTPQPSPPWAGDDATGSTLLLGVWFPNCPPDTDPEIVADCVAVIVNEERDRNGGTEGAVEVAGIPAPQWLTPETLANLKRAASGEGTAPQPLTRSQIAGAAEGIDMAALIEPVHIDTPDDDRSIVIVNELGNEIRLAVTNDDRGVTITAEGPTSTVEHTWTPMEAAAIGRLLGRGTAPQVPAEVLCVRCHVSRRDDDSPLCSACKRPDYPVALWEGESVFLPTQPGYPDEPNQSQFPFGAWLPVPPGTRVRVVAADGTPQEGDER